ncbi:hypothetical protein DQT32_04670 [Salmonella enterica subsp. enterica serovar Braenderup]|nr:hypothetical protein [Salmonella enterica subsp. enterica serovar Braenderup]
MIYISLTLLALLIVYIIGFLISLVKNIQELTTEVGDNPLFALFILFGFFFAFFMAAAWPVLAYDSVIEKVKTWFRKKKE